MPEIGQFRIVLKDDTDPAAFEAQLDQFPPQMQLTRVTSAFRARLLRLTERTADGPMLGREYIYEVTVWLVGRNFGYMWDENIDAVAHSVVDFGTVSGVESFIPLTDQETAQR